MTKELNTKPEDLINRINRIQGQLEALKKVVNDPNTDCKKAMQLLKAATNALKKFGEAYVEQKLNLCIKNKKNIQSMEKELKDVIRSSFFL